MSAEKKISSEELRLLRIVASRGGSMDHEEPVLAQFCDDGMDPYDVFNACHYKGWLRSAHDYLSGASTVYLKEAGKARVMDSIMLSEILRDALAKAKNL